MELYKRIRSRRIELGLTQEELAHMLGYTSRSTIAKIESGTNDIPQSRISDFAKALKTSPAFLMGIDELNDFYSHPDILPIETRRIPLLGDIACGDPIVANQEYNSYVEVGTDVKADFAVRAQGDSMIPKIENGDIIFVREQPVVENGEIAVVIIEDEVTLKRVRALPPDSVMLVPDNPQFEALILNETVNQNVKILGKAIALQRDVR